MTDPFIELNKIRITEEKRFDMAFKIYRDLMKGLNEAGYTDPFTVINDATNTSFNVVDTFIELYMKDYSK